MHIAGRFISFNSFEMHFPEATILDQSDLLGLGMVYDIVLVFEILPLRSESLRLDLADVAVFLSLVVLNDLIVHRDRVVVTST